MNNPTNLTNGYRHLHFDTLGSSNTAAMEYLRRGDAGKLWITAGQQTNGKGSRGREWVSNSGNMFASLALLSDQKPAVLANLSFVSALALHDCLSKFCTDEQISLKWPNDVLLNGAKISGILLESQNIAASSKTALVIGLGINIASNPAQTTYKATNLKSYGVRVAPNELFKQLNQSMDIWLNKWCDGNSFDKIRHEWLARAHGFGEQIIVKTPKLELNGIFENIDQDGCLVLKQHDGLRQTISTADIFFSNAD